MKKKPQNKQKRRRWTQKGKEEKEEEEAIRGCTGDNFDKKKEKRNKGQKKKARTLHRDKFVQNGSPTFSPNFLAILERLYFGGLGEKTLVPNQFSLQWRL